MMLVRVLRALKRSRERDCWTRQQLEAHQADRLDRLRGHAYARSRFYQRFHAGMENKPLQQLPVLTKAMLMEHFDELATDPAIRLADLRAHVATGHGERYLGRYWVCATSGSSGRPVLLLFDRSEWAVFLAGLARAHDWAGLKVSMTRRMKMAGVGSNRQANPWHPSSQAGATLNSKALRWWMPTLSLAANQPVPDLVSQLNTWQPEMLAGYPSILRVLADEQLTGRLHVHPNFIMSGSEVVTDETRRRVETAWGPVLFEAYGTTESGGGLAAECERHEGLHLFEDLAIVEAVDEHNRPVPAGEDSAKVLVTVLDSRTLPLIRYEVDDSIRMAGSTGVCGRPFALVERILGRTWDALRFPGLDGGEVTVQPLTFTAILDTLPVTGWQVIGEESGALTVLLAGVPAGLEKRAVLESIEHALAALGVDPPSITVKSVAAIPRTAAGKAPLIRSGSHTDRSDGARRSR